MQAAGYPFTLSMTPKAARAALFGKEPATAVVDLPVRSTKQEGKELVRDADGRPQGAVDRTFYRLSWDTSAMPLSSDMSTSFLRDMQRQSA